ncbi:MAG: retropepsin-like domain-containing protein [Bacteroidales bacterium]|nr:retropepsin-like domain-containing protein [Bacteroidales bacterium]
MRRYIEIPIRILDIEGDGFHIMIQGRINGKEANFLIDTGASHSVFDPKNIANFIDNPQFEKKEGITAGVGGNELESATFDIEALDLGDLEIRHYNAVALDLENIYESYEKVHLPKIDGIIGGDLLVKHKAVINFRQKKIRLTP